MGDVLPHLLVADGASSRGRIVEHLARDGYRLSEVGSIAAIRSVLATCAVDLIVLDIDLPDSGGLTLCREMPAEERSEAIVLLSAHDNPIDRVLALELGADDYLAKPFEPRELSARIRNLLRRRAGTSPARRSARRFARFGHWRLDSLKRQASSALGGEVALSRGECDILSRFLSAPGQTLTRETLAPGRASTVSFDRSIDNQISRLRQKLRPDGGDLILTVRGEGYLLASEVHFE